MKKQSNSSRAFFIFLLCSFLLHALPLLFLHFFVPPIIPQQTPPKIVQVEIAAEKLSDKNRDKKKSAENKSTSTKSTNPRTGRIGSLAPFKPSFKSWYGEGGLVFNHGDGSSGAPDDPNAKWGEGSAEFGRIADFNYLDKVKDQVEGLLYYPGVLARNHISGQVNTRLVVDGDGKCQWHHTQIHSSNAYLRIYVLDLLQKLCAHDMQYVVQQRKLSNIDMTFQFQLTETSLDLHKEKELVVGNVLSFYRNAASSTLEWQLGPIRGMFPIPAVNVDFIWIKEHWQDWVEGKPHSLSI